MYRKTQKYAWWELLYNSLNFLCLVLCHQCQLVPDDTVHKGASKHQKMDEKHPFCGARFSIHFVFKKYSPLHRIRTQKFSGMFNFILFLMLMEKTAQPFCQKIELVWFQPRNIYLFIGISFTLLSKTGE